MLLYIKVLNMEQPMKVMKAVKMPKMKKEKSTKPRLENLWVSFLKNYAKSNNITYSCALSDPRAKEQYKTGKMPMKEEPVMMMETVMMKEPMMNIKIKKPIKLKTARKKERVMKPL